MAGDVRRRPPQPPAGRPLGARQARRAARAARLRPAAPSTRAGADGRARAARSTTWPSAGVRALLSDQRRGRPRPALAARRTPSSSARSSTCSASRASVAPVPAGGRPRRRAAPGGRPGAARCRPCGRYVAVRRSPVRDARPRPPGCAAYGEVVGMSAAPRGARRGRPRLPVCVLSLVANAVGRRRSTTPRCWRSAPGSALARRGPGTPRRRLPGRARARGHSGCRTDQGSAA